MRNARRRENFLLRALDHFAGSRKGRAGRQVEGDDKITLILLRYEPFGHSHEEVGGRANQPGVNQQHERRHADDDADKFRIAMLQGAEDPVEAVEKPVRQEGDVKARLLFLLLAETEARGRKGPGLASAS